MPSQANAKWSGDQLAEKHELTQGLSLVKNQPSKAPVKKKEDFTCHPQHGKLSK